MSFDTFLEKYNLSSRDILESERWDIGGTIGSCWGIKNITPEDPPELFDSLDDLLTEINPDLDFYDKRMIQQSVANLHYGDERDWYNGKRLYAYYRCSIEDIYEELSNQGFLKDNNNYDDFDD